MVQVEELEKACMHKTSHDAAKHLECAARIWDIKGHKKRKEACVADTNCKYQDESAWLEGEDDDF